METPGDRELGRAPALASKFMAPLFLGVGTGGHIIFISVIAAGPSAHIIFISGDGCRAECPHNFYFAAEILGDIIFAINERYLAT